MDGVNKTMYIPLYGKAYVSKKGLFLEDKKAEEIWQAEGFALRGKAKSKWLAYYMGIRSRVFDEWTRQQMVKNEEAVVLHIGCGMDSRVIRVAAEDRTWYDLDFAEVIEERKRYFDESACYHMIVGDARDLRWLESIQETGAAIVLLEGVSMYLTSTEVQGLIGALHGHFEKVALLMDCYTSFAAKMSKFRNPVKQVGVTTVYGIDDPKVYEAGGITFLAEHTMIPQGYIDELKGVERFIFSKLYAGSLSKKMYRLFEYQKA